MAIDRGPYALGAILVTAEQVAERARTGEVDVVHADNVEHERSCRLAVTVERPLQVRGEMGRIRVPQRLGEKHDEHTGELNGAVDAEQVGQLVHRDQHRDPREEAGDDRRRQELGDPPEPKHHTSITITPTVTARTATSS
ncbi:MAG TPA: hypothetical protein VG410_13510 [Solirubrobacteraceae bacterium]|nr:hypothetical protein [Solirubrobacteraceae bacterium]